MLKATNISKVYKTKRGSVTALAPCSLEFGGHGLVLICGESGGGKTTLLSILAGIDGPSSGEVECSYGKNYGAFVFQGGRLSDSLTVEENFELIARLFPEKCGDFRADAEKFGLVDLLMRKPAELSFGEVQRAAILRAAMANRPVLFADEPTANLDEENCHKVAELLKDISRQRLVIVSTHKREYFEDIADRIIFLKRGKVVSDTKKSEEEGGAQAASEDEGARTANVSAPVFGFRSAVWLAAKTMRRTAVSAALAFISLLICVACIASFSNVYLFDRAVSTYTAASAEGMPFMEFMLDNSSMGGDSTALSDVDGFINRGQYSSVSADMLGKLQGECDATLFYDGSLSLDYEPAAEGARGGSITVGRLYFSDSCPFDVVYGSARLNGGMAISLGAAEAALTGFGLTSPEQLIGRTAGGVRIACIYSAESRSLEGEKLTAMEINAYDRRAVMSRAAFTGSEASELGESGRFTVVVEEQNGSIWQRYVYQYSRKDDLFDNTLVLGEAPSAAGEVCISDDYAVSRFGSAEAAVGSRLSVTYFGVDGSRNVREYTVTGITSGGTGGSNIYYTDAEALEIFNSFGDWQMNGNTGVFVQNYTADDVAYLFENGFVENSYFSEILTDSIDWLESLRIVLLAAGGLFACCGIITMAFFAVNTFSKCGREVGVLRSFGLKPSKVAAIFVCQLAALAIAAYVLGVLASLAIIPAWNFIVFSTNGACPVYFVALCLSVALAAAAALFVLGAAFICVHTLRKSTTEFIKKG